MPGPVSIPSSTAAATITTACSAIPPNAQPCLGSIDRAPFYAVPINNGDLGTKGGLKANADGQVVDQEGRPIPGLYAAGNNSGNPFGNRYPGAGGTIGPAMVFAYAAIEHVVSAAEETAAAPGDAAREEVA